MKSMTGYGRATAALGSFTLTVQVSSVNRKSLDLTMKVPDEWETLEGAIGDRVRKVAVRGKVHVDIEVTGAAAGVGVDWDDAAVLATVDRLRSLAGRQGIPFSPTTELLWSIAAAQRRSVELPPVEEAQAPVLTAVDTALAAFAAMRSTEGATLLADFLGRLKVLETQVDAVAARAPQVSSAYGEALLQRLRQSGLDLDLSDERVLKEIALFADRCDITEEITRFRSHLAQFRTLLNSDQEVGRKAEFILQEMSREVHTMGSKGNDLTIARAVIELKNELERVREQIANVE